MLAKTLLVIAVFSSSFLLFRFVFFSFKSYEEPSYQVLKEFRHIQIRQYQDYNRAYTEVSGDKQYALRHGFKRLAAYIFGKNGKRQYMDMTVPVMLESSASNWRVSFMLPRAFALDSLPKPDNTAVLIAAQDPGNYAVISFSGRAKLKYFIEKRRLLEQFLTKNHCLDQGRVVYAFYNPPWTLPFLRRNEVWIELTQECQFESSKDEK